MNVGESFLAELRQTPPTRKAKAIIQVASLFNQLLQHFPRTEFGALVKEKQCRRCAKGFGCWTQLVSMLFCNSLTLILCARFATAWAVVWGKLVHLGIGRPQ